MNIFLLGMQAANNAASANAKDWLACCKLNRHRMPITKEAPALDSKLLQAQQQLCIY